MGNLTFLATPKATNIATAAVYIQNWNHSVFCLYCNDYYQRLLTKGTYMNNRTNNACGATRAITRTHARKQLHLSAIANVTRVRATPLYTHPSQRAPGLRISIGTPLTVVTNPHTRDKRFPDSSKADSKFFRKNSTELLFHSVAEYFHFRLCRVIRLSWSWFKHLLCGEVRAGAREAVFPDRSAHAHARDGGYDVLVPYWPYSLNNYGSYWVYVTTFQKHNSLTDPLWPL